MINAAALVHGFVHSAEHGQLTELCFDSVVNFSLQFGSSSKPAPRCPSLLRDTGLCHDSGSCCYPVPSSLLQRGFSAAHLSPYCPKHIDWQTTHPKSELGAATKNTQEKPIPHLQMLCWHLCSQGTATGLSHCPSLQALVSGERGDVAAGSPGT